MKNKKFNRKELQLISIINEAKSWVSCNCELEVDKIDDGWYAGELIRDMDSGSSTIINIKNL